MINRAQQRERDRVTAALKQRTAKHGIGPMLDRIFGANSWQYDDREKLWIVPDKRYQGPGREYYCVRATGDWFKARLGQEHTQ